MRGCIILFAICLTTFASQAQSKTHLVPIGDSEVKAMQAEPFTMPIVCDRDRNLYFLTMKDRILGIHKLNSSGQQSAVMVASALPNLDIDFGNYFSVSLNGEIYQLAFLRTKADRLVVVWNKDGSFKSAIRLEPGFDSRFWTPAQVAAFSSGDVLVTGRHRKGKDLFSSPFTGIFSPDGTLRKEVVFSDDEELRHMSETGDNRVVPAVGDRFMNYAVDRGLMQTGDDGNIYLMRRLSPAIIYAVSPGGEVVKRFTVDAGDDFLPDSMHIAGNKIAMQFTEPQNFEIKVKVVDLNGHELGTYEEGKGPDGKRLINSLAFACYSEKPERFLYLYTPKDGYLGLRTAEPR